MDDGIYELASIARAETATYPRLAPWITVVELENGITHLRATDYLLPLSHELISSAFREIRHLLDGQHHSEEICQASSIAKPSTINFLLKLLSTHSALLDGKDNSNDTDFLTQVLSKEHNCTIVLTGMEPFLSFIKEDLEQLGSAPLIVAEMDASMEKWDDPSTLLVSVLSNHDIAAQMAINAHCLNHGFRWLNNSVGSISAQLGPTVIPHQSACIQCLYSRLASNDPDPLSYPLFLESLGQQRNDETAPKALGRLLTSQIVLEVVRLLTGHAQPHTIGRYYQFNIDSPETTGHRVLKVPRCSACFISTPSKTPWDSFISQGPGR